MSDPEMGRVVVVKTDGKPGLEDAICAALWERIGSYKGKARCLQVRQLMGYVHGLMEGGFVDNDDYQALFERLRLIEAEAWQ